MIFKFFNVLFFRYYNEIIYFVSILFNNVIYACGMTIQSLRRLLIKVFTNGYKDIADPQVVRMESLNRFSIKGLSYVKSDAVIGVRTRNSVKGYKQRMRCNNFKGIGLFVRSYCTVGRNWSSDIITQKIQGLMKFSVKNDINGVNSTVKHLLGESDFWILCYESIKSKPGNSTLGGSLFSGESQSLDGINLDFFSKLSKSIISGRFQFGSTRRCNVLKQTGGIRQLGTADSRDKIVQKGLVVILEQLAEYRFYEGSFGFRRDKSCKSAIEFIRKKVPSGMWAIEGDISNCFDSFDHKRLVSLIKSKYVNQQVFLDLIYKALKVRIVSISSSSLSKMGVPQGSVLSSVLCNIYLNELDMFINNSNLLDKFRNKSKAVINYQFVKALKFTKGELEEGKLVLKHRGKLKYWKFLQKLRIKKIKQAEKNNIPRLLYKGENRKFLYVRYANDFLVFVWGSKNDCLEIRKLIKNFLVSELALNLSIEKTNIVYLKKRKVSFVGFDIWQSPNRILSQKKDLNPIGKLDRSKISAKYRGAVMSVPRIRITFSIKKVLRCLFERGLVRYKKGKFFPDSLKTALNYGIENIVSYLKYVFLGLANYYGIADNWYDAKSVYNYFGLFCTAITIAHKTKSKVPKVFKKYGSLLSVSDSNNKVVCSFGKLSNAFFTRLDNKEDVFYHEVSVESLLISNLKIARNHMIRWPCSICGDENSEIHHIRHVKKALIKKRKNTFNYY